MTWGWEVVRRFPGAVLAAWGLFAFWGVGMAAAVAERERRETIEKRKRGEADGTDQRR
jgi:hypothetical protein